MQVTAKLYRDKTTFVFQPGGTDGGNIYTDWATLYQALAASSGPRIVEIDDTFTSPAVIPAGTYEMNDVSLQGQSSKLFSALNLSDGVVLNNLPAIAHNLNVISLSNTPVLVYTTGFRELILGNNTQIGSIGAADFLDVSGTANVNIRLELGQLNAKSVNITGTGLITVDAEEGFIQANAFDGDGGITIFYDAASYLDPNAAALFTGSYSPFLSDQATQVNYAPSAPGNWVDPDPTTVQEAIDRIADVVSAGGGTPIP